MTVDKDDNAVSNNDSKARGVTNPPRANDRRVPNNDRREPNFGHFDEGNNEEYEEPDRDTDFSSGYASESVADEDEFEGAFAEDDEEDLFPPENEAPLSILIDEAKADLKEALENGSEEDETEESDAWLEDDEYYEDDVKGGSSWPLSMIAVACVALVLLAVGIYGVMQERAATQAELRDLRATLATSPNREGADTNREVNREKQQSYDTLAAEAKVLTQENQILTEAVAGLNAQLRDLVDEQQVQAPPATAKQPTPVSRRDTLRVRPTLPPPVATKPVAPATAVTKPATPVSAERWFVNFGSYSSRTMAKSWAAKIQPAAGKVIVAPGTKDGKTYYRVRVVELTGKGSADKVARQLEKELQVSRLWVGQE
jgi:cell division septation protein DedD